jgi:hypothetical protein
MQFKHDIGRAFDPEAILAWCRSIGHVWKTWQLDPVVTLQGFLLQMLHGNTACSHVPRRHPQGTGHVRNRLQLLPTGDAGGRAAAADRSGPSKLR